MDQSLDIDPIVTKYVREEELTAEETAILRDWIARGQGRQELLDRLRNDPDWTKQNLIQIQDLPDDRIWTRLVNRLQAEGYWREPETLAVPIIPQKKTVHHLWRYLAAASVVTIVVGISIWVLRNK